MSEVDENMLYHTYGEPCGEGSRIDDASCNNRRELLISALEEIVGALKKGDIADKQVEATLRALSKKLADPTRRLAKKELLAFYLAQKSQNSELWQRWTGIASCEKAQSGDTACLCDDDGAGYYEEKSSALIDEQIDDKLVKLLRAKPRRTASGVATVTLLTKPWPCGGDCICCPNDVRMPKSYLSDEPACQRAERCWFDPYLQMAARLSVLADMGHNIDKVEVIVLGGTFSDYPQQYQIWYMEQIFECLNDFGSGDLERKCQQRRGFYEGLGLASDPQVLAEEVSELQGRVNRGEITYNEAIALRNSEQSRRTAASTNVKSGGVHVNYSLAEALDNMQTYSPAEALDNMQTDSPAEALERMQTATMDELAHQHLINETAAHRCVGLCVETRPELVTPEHLLFLRKLGCTKLQIGVQALDDDVLAAMGRAARVADVERAFELMRLFGFKSHIHIMANLPGATPELDKAAYKRLVTDERFMPDEVKLYPCSLVESAHLMSGFTTKDWQPYPEEVLVDVLVDDLLATPCHTRISRMIRDISSKDIVAGNKKTNLRQLVEERASAAIASLAAASAAAASTPPVASATSSKIQEMRSREIATDELDGADFHIEEHNYKTSNTDEVFIQYVDEEGRLAAFCRLSLPNASVIGELQDELQSELSKNDGGISTAQTNDSALYTNTPLRENEAMIREVHVYGRVSKLHESKEGAQHLGFGRSLVFRAIDIARERGYNSIAVISAVGTRDYYRSLGFDSSLPYQRRVIN